MRIETVHTDFAEGSIKWLEYSVMVNWLHAVNKHKTNGEKDEVFETLEI